MKDEAKTKKQLINELHELRQRMAILKSPEEELGQLKGNQETIAEAFMHERHEREERYRNILESIQEGYFELDLTGTYTFANDANCRFLGYTREELIGMNARKHSLSEENLKKIEQAYIRLYQTGKPIKSLEFESIRKDGTKVIYETSVTLRKDPEGNPIGFRGVSRDITERRQMEVEREKLISELQKALSEIKKLSGLLPICASCKKIRNDQGYWEQIEGYIRDRSEAEFSHGICPDCARRIYPGLLQEK
jgi:PAS domain S-box-containing protein